MRKERAAGMIAAGKKQGEIAKKLVRRHHGTVKEWRADPKVQQTREQGRTRKGKRTERALITRAETHSSQSAAMTLARVLHLDKQIAPNPNDPALLKKLLDERVAFAIEGFKSGGVTLTRRDVLKLAAAHAPESFRDVMSLNTLPSLRGKIRPGSARLSRRKKNSASSHALLPNARDKRDKTST